MKPKTKESQSKKSNSVSSALDLIQVKRLIQTFKNKEFFLEDCELFTYEKAHRFENLVKMEDYGKRINGIRKKCLLKTKEEYPVTDEKTVVLMKQYQKWK